VLLLMGIRGKKYGTSHVDNRVTKARMGYSAGNRLPLGGFPFSVSFAVAMCIPGTIFLGNWPKISWPEKAQLGCRETPRPQVLFFDKLCVKTGNYSCFGPADRLLSAPVPLSPQPHQN
jgi:hypothetical protein